MFSLVRGNSLYLFLRSLRNTLLLKNRYFYFPLVVLLVILFLAGTVIFLMASLDKTLEVLPEQFEKISSINEIKSNILRQSNAIKAYLIYGDEKDLNEFRKISAKNSVLESDLIRIVRESRKHQAMEIKSLNDRYKALCEQEVIPLIQAGKNTEAIAVIRQGEIKEVYEVFTAKADELEKTRINDTFSIISQAISSSRRAVASSVILTVIGLLTGLFASACFAQKMLRENLLFRLIMATTKNAVITTNHRCEITYFNRVAEDIFAISREQVIGRRFGEVFTGKNNDGEIALHFNLKDVLTSHTGMCSLERSFTDYEGWNYVLGIDCLPFEVVFDNPLGALFLARDITEKKVIEDKLRGLTQKDSMTMLYNHSYLKERLRFELENSAKTNSPVSFMLIDLDNFKFYNDSFGHPAGDELLKEFSRLLEKRLRQTDVFGRYGGDEFGVILPDTDGTRTLEIAERLRSHVQSYRFPYSEYMPGEAVTISIGIAYFPDDAQSADDLIRMADEALYNAKRNRKNKVELYFSAFKKLEADFQSDESMINTIKTLLSVINAKDRYTYGHSEKVMEYVGMITKRFSFAKNEGTKLKLAAFLHDLGKIDICQDILNKTGVLTEKEWKIIKQHPVNGANIVCEWGNLRELSPSILYHHERFDGTGYPEGLSRQDIPLGARIIAVADSFDAMTTDRPYKKGKSFEEALIEIKRQAGRQFDPHVVDIFIEEFMYYSAKLFTDSLGG